MEGQMPEILTMIQINRMTPAPAVLFMSFLSLAYLGSSNIEALISYVGFATWVSHSLEEEKSEDQSNVMHEIAMSLTGQLKNGNAIIVIDHFDWYKCDGVCWYLLYWEGKAKLLT